MPVPTILSLTLALLPNFTMPTPRQETAEVPQAEIDTAIDRGIVFLAGAFPELEVRRGKRKAPKERIGLRALCLYTLLKSGADHDDPAVQRLIYEIGAEEIDQTYDATCVILALVAHDPIAHRPQIEALARLLVSWQEKDGSWGYPGFIIDLSNTQYAALGLWAATRAGVRIEPQVWIDLTAVLFTFQDSAGGFGYTPGGKGGSGSMTAAGVGTLSLCEIHLRLLDALPGDLAARIARVRSEGLAWLDKYFAVDTNPKSGAWLYYYLYGLERMGGLGGTREIGDHDWYQEGARYLVDEQDEDGGWVNGTDFSDTCFALLFLQRATAGDSGPRRPLTGGGRRLEGDTEEEAKGAFHLEVKGTGPVKIAMESFDPKAVGVLEWEGERGLGPHIERVEYFAGEERIGVVLGDGRRPARNAPFTLRWVPAREGEVELSAVAFVRAPVDGARIELRSATKTITIERALPTWMSGGATPPGVNLGTSFRPKASASSEHAKDAALGGIEYEADLASDGLLGTSWLAEPDDKKRALKISYRKAKPVDIVRVWPASWPAAGAEFFARPVLVEIAINGGKGMQLRLEGGPGEPAVFELKKSTKIKRLDVRLLEVEAGEHASTGIAEVELFAR